MCVHMIEQHLNIEWNATYYRKAAVVNKVAHTLDIK